MAGSSGFATASTGPDGLRDIALPHFMLYLALENMHGKPARGAGPYLRLTPEGYAYERDFRPDADIVRHYPEKLRSY